MIKSIIRESVPIFIYYINILYIIINIYYKLYTIINIYYNKL